MRGARVGVAAGVALLLGGAVLGGMRGARALDLSGPTEDPDPQGAPLPAATPAALWAGPLSQAEVAPAVRKGLDHHPALVVAAAAAPERGSGAGHRALAATATDPALAEAIRARLRLTPAELGWALDPALADAAAAGCPDRALGFVCERGGRAVVEAQVDAVLGALLSDPEQAEGALQAACRLGAKRGAGLVAAMGTPAGARERARLLRLQACTQGADAAPDLRAAAAGGDAVAAVAVLELRGLGLDPGTVAPAGSAAGIAAGAGAP